MHHKELLIGAIVGIVAVSAVFFLTPNEPAPVPERPERREEPSVRAVASPDIPSPWVRWGGVTVYNAKQTMQTATTTLCWIANPRSATSSVRSFVAQITTGTSTAANITLATSSSRYATSTSDELIADHPVASGAQDTITYNASTANANIIGPSEYLLLQTAGAGAGGYTYTGHCQATFEAIIP